MRSLLAWKERVVHRASWSPVLNWLLVEVFLVWGLAVFSTSLRSFQECAEREGGHTSLES